MHTCVPLYTFRVVHIHSMHICIWILSIIMSVPACTSVQKRMRDRDPSSSVDVTPKRVHKRRRIRRKSRMPDPGQSSTSKTSSQSSLSLHQLSVCTAKKELKFPALKPDIVSSYM